MWEYKFDEKKIKGLTCDVPGPGLKVGTVRVPLKSNPKEKVLYPLLWEFDKDSMTLWRRRLDFFNQKARYVQNATDDQVSEVGVVLNELAKEAAGLEAKLSNDAKQRFVCNGKCTTAIKHKNAMEKLQGDHAGQIQTLEARLREADDKLKKRTTASKVSTSKDEIQKAVDANEKALMKKHTTEINQLQKEISKLHDSNSDLEKDAAMQKTRADTMEACVAKLGQITQPSPGPSTGTLSGSMQTNPAVIAGGMASGVTNAALSQAAEMIMQRMRVRGNTNQHGTFQEYNPFL